MNTNILISKLSRKKVGELGENIACRFIVSQGFRLIERNYRKKCGEIDIVAEKGSILHFFEVKSGLIKRNDSKNPFFTLEEKVDRRKQKKWRKVTEMYLKERGFTKKFGDIARNGDEAQEEFFQFHVLSVLIAPDLAFYKLKMLKDIVI